LRAKRYSVGQGQGPKKQAEVRSSVRAQKINADSFKKAVTALSSMASECADFFAEFQPLYCKHAAKRVRKNAKALSFFHKRLRHIRVLQAVDVERLCYRAM